MLGWKNVEKSVHKSILTIVVDNLDQVLSSQMFSICHSLPNLYICPTPASANLEKKFMKSKGFFINISCHSFSSFRHKNNVKLLSKDQLLHQGNAGYVFSSEKGTKLHTLHRARRKLQRVRLYNPRGETSNLHSECTSKNIESLTTFVVAA